MHLRTIDLFCGCGGFTQGLIDVGFDVVCGIDINQSILDTYANNFEHDTICHDLSDWKSIAIELQRRYNIIDVVAGSPPCIEFSRAGRQIEGDIASLTLSFAHIIESILPRMFIMENVPDIIHSKTFAEFTSHISRIGYDFCTIVQDAKYCHSPQARRRVFVVGCIQTQDSIKYLDNLLDVCKQRTKTVTIRQHLTANNIDCPNLI